jgi:hypothetical protein
MVKSLLVDAAMVAGARGIPLAARVLTLLALARYTSEQDFAHAALIVAIAEAGRLVADLGTDTWSIRAIATSKSEDARALIIGDSLAVKALASSLLILSLWIAQSRLLPPMSITDLLLITMLVLSSQFVGLATSVEQALAKLRSLLPILAASYSLIFVIALLAATRTADGRLSLMAFGLCEAIVAGILLARLSDFQAVHCHDRTLFTSRRHGRCADFICSRRHVQHSVQALPAFQFRGGRTRVGCVCEIVHSGTVLIGSPTSHRATKYCHGTDSRLLGDRVALAARPHSR